MVQNLGQIDEAEKLARTVVDIAEKVLAQRPADLRAMQIRFYGANMLGSVALDRNDLAKAEYYNGKSLEAGRAYTYFNPADATGWGFVVQGGRDLASTYVEQGRLAEGKKVLLETAAVEHDPRNKTGTEGRLFYVWRLLEAVEVQTGNPEGARAALAEVRRVGPLITRDRGGDAVTDQIGELSYQVFENDLDAARNDYAAVLTRAREVDARLRKIESDDPANKQFRDDTLRRNQSWMIEGALRVGNFEEAVALSTSAVEKPILGRVRQTALEDQVARARVRQGQALLGAGRRDEAKATLEAALVYYRKQEAAGASGMGSRQDRARVLYFLAQAQPLGDAGDPLRRQLLAEADATLQGMTFESQQTLASRELIQWVHDARVQAGG